MLIPVVARPVDRQRLHGIGQLGPDPFERRSPQFDVAILELSKPNVENRIRELVPLGVPVLAFGAHVDASALRAARELGARAVPNSEVESSLRALL
jgi:hypothetical protein